MSPMSTTDLETRYGPMVSLDELAAYFHAHIRAVRNSLESKGIPIFSLGKSTVVPMRLVERGFGLEEAAMDEDAIRRESARIRSAYHPDGSPKSVREYAGEVRGRAPQWQRLIDEARRESAAAQHATAE